MTQPKTPEDLDEREQNMLDLVRLSGGVWAREGTRNLEALRSLAARGLVRLEVDRYVSA